jgi:hypothetical protein
VCRSSQKITWDNPVVWLYEIGDSSQVVALTGKGLETEKAAMAVGRKKREN